jgi:type IV pilus assembly protein PilY1
MGPHRGIAQWRRWLASLLAALLGLGPLATPTYAALTLLGDQPLSVQNQAKPNIMLTVDDSTSMLYDFLPDSAISKYCRDITGNMNAACGRIDTNVDLTLIGHGHYITPGYIYEQYGMPFPAYNAAFDTSGPGAGCDTSSLPTSTCTGGIPPGALPGLERYPGPPGPNMSPLAGKPYEYWTLWPAPVHNSELNHNYYNPRLNYDPPAFADGTSYPQMNAANTANWTHVPADPWASTVKYVDLTQQVTIGLWCNSDWSQGLETDPRYCRTNGVGPTATGSSAASADGDYSFPWAPPGIDPSAGGTTALSIAYSKVNATTHALLAAWSTAKDPKYYYQNDNIIWCDSTSPLWPAYGPLLTQTCSDPPPTSTPQICQGVTDQTCGGGTHETCVGVTPQVCNNAQPQTCNSINPQTCDGAQPQTCSGQMPQTCNGVGNQTCTGVAPQTCNGSVTGACQGIGPQTCNGATNQICDGYQGQTCNGAVFPTCDNVNAQSCNGAINQTCGGMTGQTCQGVVTQVCNAITPQSCDGVQTQTCNPVGEVCNLPDPNSCPVVWMPPGCPCEGQECQSCHLEHVCPPGSCSVTGGQCNSNADCPGTRQCSISGNACNVNSDCGPLAGQCSITHNACTTPADCTPLGQCSAVPAACASNADCPPINGTCSITHNTCTNDGQCPNSGNCTNSGAVCTSDAQCPNTPGTCSVTAQTCATAADCPPEGQCSNNGLPCANASQCPAVPGSCSLSGLSCFNDAQCPNQGTCTSSGAACTTNAQCPNTPGQCSTSHATCAVNADCPDTGTCNTNGAACTNDGQCPNINGTCSTDGAACTNDAQCPAEGHCSIVGNICTVDAQCPQQPGTCSLSGAACFNDPQCPPFGGQCTVTHAACIVDPDCPTVAGHCSADAQACTVNADCAGSGQCSVTSAVCHNNGECPIVPGTCSISGSACTVDANCAPQPGHCSTHSAISCNADVDCPGTSDTCSQTGEACSGTWNPYCDLSFNTCTEPAYCPRQGGTCSIDGSPCNHLFWPPWYDITYCWPVTTQGKCSIDHNSCSYDSQCPPIPQASASAVCSDLVAGSTTMSVPVPNGNFESPVISNYQYAPGGASWTWGPSSGIQRYYSDFGAYPSNDLWQTAFIQGAGSFSQSINLPAGSYRISFQAARRPYSVPAGTVQPIIVLLDGVALGPPVSPTTDFYFNTFAFGFSIASPGMHTFTFAGTDGSGDKTTFIDQVSISSGMSLLEDANSNGLVCRHNNKQYGVVSAAPYNYPDTQFNTPVSAGSGPNACTSSPRYASVPRHYYKTSVEWCDKQIATAGDKWLGYGTPTGGSCQDSPDSAHQYPRFYQFGQAAGTDNYGTPAFARIDLDITKRATATYTHTWTDDSGDVQTITRNFDGATPDVSEMTNYANWFAYYRTRIQAVKSVTSLTFVELDQKYRVGFHNLFKLSSFVNIADFAAAQKTAWFNQLFGVQIPLGQETPSLDAVVRIGEYYKNGTHPQLAGSTDPIVLACQKNWHMFFTDGFTNQNALPSVLYGDQDDVVPALPAPVVGLTTGQPWPPPFREDALAPASNGLSDYAMYYWVTDLRTSGPQAVNNVPSSVKDPAVWQHQNFAAISLGTSGKLNTSNQSITESQLTAGALQWPKPYPSVNKPDNSGVDDLWHAAINGRGRFVNAESADEVKLGIGQILADIVNQSGVRAGVGFRSVNFGPNANFIYEVAFEPGWAGSLAKLQIDPTSGAVIAQAWEASAQLDNQLLVIPGVKDTPWFTERKIVTLNQGGTPVPFLWGNLGANQQDSLAPGKPPARTQMILEFLRGNRSKEGAKLNQLRSRSSALGDFADSGAVYVGPPNAPYLEAFDPGYAAFRSTFAGRAARLYAGANDGMMHVFDDATGNETWAYVPSVLFRGGLAGGDPKTGLGALSYQDGALPPFKHHYYVDGTPKVVDVNFQADTGGQDWRTLLVGGLGKGGAAYYALDVTDPTSITNEAAAANRVLWEFKPSDLGYTYGKPIIAKTRAFNGAWVVVVASGYNNASGIGKLFFIKASDGSLLKTMSTGIGTPGTPSGLAHPAAYTKDYHNQLMEQIYAGDLMGNFWRFDVSDPNPGNWTVGQMASLVDPSGVAQPVTTPPQIEIDISNGVDRWVFVGTGKLYDDSDLASTQIQTMYALRDGTADSPWALPTPATSRATVGMLQVSHDAALDFGLANKPDKGWWDDLPAGQQMVVAPSAALSIVTYIGTSAQSDPCLTGMAANIYARDYATGKSQLTDDGGTVVESVGIAEGGVGIEIVSVQAPTGGPPDIRIVITRGVKGPPIVLKPKPPALLSQHRMSWRLLGE